MSFMIQGDQPIPDYRTMCGDYIAEDLERRRHLPLQEFALWKLTDINLNVFEDETEFKGHVCALGKIVLFDPESKLTSPECARYLFFFF